MMALGFGVLLWIGYGLPGETSFHPALGGLALGTAIVVYDWHHKENPLSPVLMGLCRMLVYITAGLAVSASLPGPLLAAALVLLCYLIGLTYIAKQETLGEVKNLWPALFLAVPVVYGAATALDHLTGVVVFVAFVAWLGIALRYLKRRAPGDVPHAVTSLLAGICLLDAVLIAGAGAVPIAWLAVLAFFLTLALQRFVPAT
jgi:4-hydroxybenzoate polyprenyltransferase